MSHSHQGSDIPRVDLGFNNDESISDFSEAIGVGRMSIPAPPEGAGYSEVWSEAAWPVGSSQSGGTIGIASHAPSAALVSKIQSESIREWTATDSKGRGLSSNSPVVALDSRPKGRSHTGPLYVQGR